MKYFISVFVFVLFSLICCSQEIRDTNKNEQISCEPSKFESKIIQQKEEDTVKNIEIPENKLSSQSSNKKFVAKEPENLQISK